MEDVTTHHTEARASDTTRPVETVFTWQRHTLYISHNGFGKQRGTCTRCNQRFNSQPKAATCPGVPVYSPYALPGNTDRWPEYMMTAEELTKENLMPESFSAVAACLHTHGSTAFVPLYDRRKAVTCPTDYRVPDEALKASCAPSSTQPRAPRAPRVKMAPDLPSAEKAAQIQVNRERRGEHLPTSFQEDRQHYALHLAFEKSALGSRLFWSHHGNYWSLQELLAGVRQGAWGGETGIRFTVIASYDGESIGRGLYRKNGARQDLTQIATEETSGALIGLLEQTISTLLAEEEAEALREAEAQRTIPCAYCQRSVLVREGPVRHLTIQVDQGEPVSFDLYACQLHAEYVRQATLLNVELRDTHISPALGTWKLSIAPVLANEQ